MYPQTQPLPNWSEQMRKNKVLYKAQYCQYSVPYRSTIRPLSRVPMRGGVRWTSILISVWVVVLFTLCWFRYVVKLSLIIQMSGLTFVNVNTRIRKKVIGGKKTVVRRSNNWEKKKLTSLTIELVRTYEVF